MTRVPITEVQKKLSCNKQVPRTNFPRTIPFVNASNRFGLILNLCPYLDVRYSFFHNKWITVQLLSRALPSSHVHETIVRYVTIRVKHSARLRNNGTCRDTRRFTKRSNLIKWLNLLSGFISAVNSSRCEYEMPQFVSVWRMKRMMQEGGNESDQICSQESNFDISAKYRSHRFDTNNEIARMERRSKAFDFCSRVQAPQLQTALRSHLYSLVVWVAREIISTQRASWAPESIGSTTRTERVRSCRPHSEEGAGKPLGSAWHHFMQIISQLSLSRFTIFFRVPPPIMFKDQRGVSETFKITIRTMNAGQIGTERDSISSNSIMHVKAPREALSSRTKRTWRPCWFPLISQRRPRFRRFPITNPVILGELFMIRKIISTCTTPLWDNRFTLKRIGARACSQSTFEYVRILANVSILPSLETKAIQAKRYKGTTHASQRIGERFEW